MLRTRIRRQSSMTPPSTSPTTAPSGPAPKIRLESLQEEVQFPGADVRSPGGAAHGVAIQA